MSKSSQGEIMTKTKRMGNLHISIIDSNNNEGAIYNYCSESLKYYQKSDSDNKIIYRHSLPISGKVTTEDIRSYLENILSEFNHLVSMLLKGGNVAETTQILIKL